MYPTVVSASLRLLSNTYPPYPPFFLSAPPEGDRPSSIPDLPRRHSFGNGFTFGGSGYSGNVGEEGT